MSGSRKREKKDQKKGLTGGRERLRGSATVVRRSETTAKPKRVNTKVRVD